MMPQQIWTKPLLWGKTILDQGMWAKESGLKLQKWEDGQSPYRVVTNRGKERENTLRGAYLQFIGRKEQQ